MSPSVTSKPIYVIYDRYMSVIDLVHSRNKFLVTEPGQTFNNQKDEFSKTVRHNKCIIVIYKPMEYIFRMTQGISY